jgi:phosphoribosylglycinamide formyltransferase-1
MTRSGAPQCRPLEVDHQLEAAIGGPAPAELNAVSEAGLQQAGFRLAHHAQGSAPGHLRSEGLKAGGEQMLIGQHRGQDGEMRHSPSSDTEGSDPSDGRVRVGVLASGGGSNFEALVQACRDDRQRRAEVVLLIVNRPEAGAIARAERLGVPCCLLDHRRFASRGDLDDALVDRLQQDAVELVVMAGWMRIVTSRLIQAFPGRLLNLHPSLLPAFRGLDAIGQALAAGVGETGCTVHEVVEEVDAGPVLAQAVVPVLPGETRPSLEQRIHREEHRILPQAVLARAEQLQRQARGVQG